MAGNYYLSVNATTSSYYTLVGKIILLKKIYQFLFFYLANVKRRGKKTVNNLYTGFPIKIVSNDI